MISPALIKSESPLTQRERGIERDKARLKSSTLGEMHSLLQPAESQGRLRLVRWVCVGRRGDGPLLFLRCDCMIAPLGCKLWQTESSRGDGS